MSSSSVYAGNRYNEWRGASPSFPDRYKRDTSPSIHDRYKRDTSPRIHERYRIGQGHRVGQSQQWSNEKVIDELSSFINEFSYLASEQSGTSQPKQTPGRNQSYYDYATKTDSNQDIYTSSLPYKYQGSLEAFHAKAVEWKDRRNFSMTSGNEKHPVVRRPEHRMRGFRSRSRNPRSKIRKIPRSKSRPRRSLSRFRSKSREHHKPRRFKSQNSMLRVRSSSPRRHRRIRRSSSNVKDIPYRYRSPPKEKPVKKMRRPIIVKKRRPMPPPILKKEVPAPCDDQTVVTLYPHDKTQLKPVFITDPELPCKCLTCKQRYRSLLNLSFTPCGMGDVCPTPYPVACVGHPRFTRPCTTRVCNPAFNTNPCVNRCFMPDCYTGCCYPGNQCAASCCYKSVHFKFDCFGQSLGSDITQYFHSILNKTVYC